MILVDREFTLDEIECIEEYLQNKYFPDGFSDSNPNPQPTMQVPYTNPYQANHVFEVSESFGHYYSVCKQPKFIGKGWCATDNDDGNATLMVNLGGLYSIDSVITKGRENLNEWVISYNLYYSRDGIEWKSDGIHNPLQGNSDSVNAKQNYFASPIFASHLKFEPVTYYGRKSMRIEVIGQLEDTESIVDAANPILKNDRLIDLKHWQQDMVQIKQHPYFNYFAFAVIILLIINTVCVVIYVGNKRVSKQHKYNRVAVVSE